MKKLLVIVLVAMSLMFCACNNLSPANQEESSESQDAGYSLELSRMTFTIEEAVRYAPHIFKAKVLSVEPGNNALGAKLIRVHPITFFQGYIEGDSIDLTGYGDSYKTSQEYYFFVTRRDDVYTQTRTNAIVASLYKTENGLYPDTILDINGLDEVHFVERLKSVIQEKGYVWPEEISGEYIRSEDPLAILENSPLVYRVVIENYEDDLHLYITKDRATMRCKVIETIKGPKQNEIVAILPVNSFQVGGEYVLLLVKSDEESTWHFISSPNSVWEMDYYLKITK